MDISKMDTIRKTINVFVTCIMKKIVKNLEDKEFIKKYKPHINYLT